MFFVHSVGLLNVHLVQSLHVVVVILGLFAFGVHSVRVNSVRVIGYDSTGFASGADLISNHKCA